ncbi:hypothetical protein HYX14_03580 [Candidatus Woesearchaeota archaeon]|nr:hypothetical protein [Candidatus Woesearchaeota archaeon]
MRDRFDYLCPSVYHFEFDNNEGSLREVRFYEGYFRERGFQFLERQKAVKQKPYIEKSVLEQALEMKVVLGEESLRQRLMQASVYGKTRYGRILTALQVIKQI